MRAVRRPVQRTDLLVPTQKNATADIPPSWQAHAFIQILHEGVLCILGDRLDDCGDLSGLGVV